MYLKNVILFLIGTCSGGMAAAGVFSFIVMIGIFTRLASRTRTSSFTNLYENMIVLGGSIGNFVMIYPVNIPLRHVGLVTFGLFSGIFIGCLAMALSEVLNVFPILVKRAGLIKGIPLIVLSIALGKTAGALLHFLIL